MPLLDPQVSAKLGTLQSLDDAIAYRIGRLQAPCHACGTGTRCRGHHDDEHLITRYQDRHAAALRDFLAGMDPADIALIMQPGDDTPATVAAFSIAMLARLRELTTDGPVLADLHDGPAIFAQDGPVITEHSMQPRAGS